MPRRGTTPYQRGRRFSTRKWSSAPNTGPASDEFLGELKLSRWVAPRGGSPPRLQAWKTTSRVANVLFLRRQEILNVVSPAPPGNHEPLFHSVHTGRCWSAERRFSCGERSFSKQKAIHAERFDTQDETDTTTCLRTSGETRPVFFGPPPKKVQAFGSSRAR